MRFSFDFRVASHACFTSLANKVKVYRVKNDSALRSIPTHMSNVFLRKVTPAKYYRIEIGSAREKVVAHLVDVGVVN